MTWLIGSPQEEAGIRLLEAEMARASDRAVAVLGGSLVESSLTRFLKSILHDDGKIWQDRTHSSAPLGSFSMKIDLAFMVGRITKRAHTDLVCLKDIRNKFAHNLEVADFSDQSVAMKCANLSLVDDYVIDTDALSTIKNMLQDNGRTSFRIGGADVRETLTRPRERYLWTVKVLVMGFGFGRQGDDSTVKTNIQI